MKLQVLPYNLTVCKIADLHQADLSAGFFCLARSENELSLVCRTEDVPPETLEREDGWHAFRIEGPLDFALIGILAGIASVLAENSIPIFAVSTYDTDTVLVKAENFARALQVLQEKGYEVNSCRTFRDSRCISSLLPDNRSEGDLPCET